MWPSAVYAIHPMSYYGEGDVSADFLGLARRRGRRNCPACCRSTSPGCSGNVTAGKYNDGAREPRPSSPIACTRRWRAAWEATVAIRSRSYDYRVDAAPARAARRRRLHDRRSEQTARDRPKAFRPVPRRHGPELAAARRRRPHDRRSRSSTSASPSCCSCPASRTSNTSSRPNANAPTPSSASPATATPRPATSRPNNTSRRTTPTSATGAGSPPAAKPECTPPSKNPYRASPKFSG